MIYVHRYVANETIRLLHCKISRGTARCAPTFVLITMQQLEV